MLNLNDCKDYLKGMYFTNIFFSHFETGSYFFIATDEDDQEKQVQFEPQENGSIIVSVQDPVSKIYNILEILKED